MKKGIWYGAWGAAVVAMVALLSACGGGGDSTGQSSNKKVAIVAAVQLPTQATEMCAAKEVLSKAGFDVNIQYPPKYDPTVQIPIFNAALNTHPAGILLSAADPKALEPPVKQAVNQGIKVVTVDTGLEDPQAAGVSSSVATNDVAAGEGAAELIGEATKGKTGEVALLTYSPGAAQVADDRAHGFEATISKYPNLDFVGVSVADGLPEAAAKTNALLASHPNLIAIDGDWTGASEGMLQALRQRGLTDKVIAVANDADAPLIEAISKGYLYGSVFPKIYSNGVEAGEQLVNALTGKPTTETIASLPVTATKQNMDDPQVSKYFLEEEVTC